MTTEEIEAWCERWTDDPNRFVSAVNYEQIIQSQPNIFPDRVEFWRACIRNGAFPPPVKGIRASVDHVILVDGHHRAKAWYQEGFRDIPGLIENDHE